MTKTNQMERKLMKMYMAHKFEKAHMKGKVFLTKEGMKLIQKAKEGK